MDLTYAEVQAWAGERRSLFGALHTEMGIDEDFLNAAATWKSTTMQKYLSGLPKGFIARIMPIAQDAVKVGLDQTLVGETPTVKVLLPLRPRQDREKAQRQAQALEKKLQALLFHIDNYASETPLRQFMWHCLALGVGVLSYAIAYDRWPEDPFKMPNGKRRKPANARERKEDEEWQEKRKRAIPWDVRALHPRRVLWDPWHDPSEDVITEEKVSIRAYAHRFPHLGALAALRPVATGTLLTYCSPEWYGLWLDGRPLLTAADGAAEDGVAENTQGILWYKFVHSGFGQLTYEGRWEHRVRGLLRDARDVIAMYISAVNQMEAIRGTYAFPPMDITGETKEQADEESEDMAFGPAAKFTHSAGVNVSVMQLPVVPQAVFQTIEQVRGFLEVHFGPEILRGVFRDDTASGQRTRLSQAKAAFRPARQGGQQAVAAMLMDMCYSIKEELDGPITVLDAQGSEVELSARDIPDGIRILVDFAPPTAEDKAAELAEAMQKLQQGLVSRKRVLQMDPDIEDLDEERAEIMSDKLQETEPVMAVMAQMTADQLQQQLGAMQPAEQAASPEPAAPPQPPAVNPGGFQQPGEQPAPPAFGSPQDQAQQQPFMPSPGAAPIA